MASLAGTENVLMGKFPCRPFESVFRSPRVLRTTKNMSAQSLLASLEQLDTNAFKDEAERTEARLAAMRLLTRVETPWETATRLGWMEVCYAL